MRLLAQVKPSCRLRGALTRELVSSRGGCGVGGGVVERMIRRVQVVLVFHQQVDWQPRPGSLELIVHNQVGIEEPRQEVKPSDIAKGVDGDVGTVRHAIRPKGAG